MRHHSPQGVVNHWRVGTGSYRALPAGQHPRPTLPERAYRHGESAIAAPAPRSRASSFLSARWHHAEKGAAMSGADQRLQLAMSSAHLTSCGWSRTSLAAFLPLVLAGKSARYQHSQVLLTSLSQSPRLSGLLLTMGLRGFSVERCG